MSLKAMVWVMENSDAKLGDRLVLLALAEHAGDDGEDTFPSQATIARKSALSERQVRRCLANLERDGRVERDGTTRYGTINWRIRMTPDNMSARTSTTPEPDRMSPEPSFEPVSVSKDLESLSLTANELPVVRAREKPRPPMKVDRKRVKPHEAELAQAVLAQWNILTNQTLSSDEWRRKIILRIREHPELGVYEHGRLIAVALDNPWWSGHPSPSVIYGNGAVFEQAITLAQQGPAPPKASNGAMRYGRGVTPAQAIEAGRKWE